MWPDPKEGSPVEVNAFARVERILRSRGADTEGFLFKSAVQRRCVTSSPSASASERSVESSFSRRDRRSHARRRETAGLRSNVGAGAGVQLMSGACAAAAVASHEHR
jgi:hypothetical protein